jgi:hypothetical protein
MFFTPQAETPTKQLSAREKAVSILQILIDSRKSNKSYLAQNLVKELNSYKDSIDNVEEDQNICKVYILYAILDMRLKAGEEESETLFEKINNTATEIIDLYNTENPDKQQFNNMPALCYTPPNMQPSNLNA